MNNNKRNKKMNMHKYLCPVCGTENEDPKCTKCGKHLEAINQLIGRMSNEQ